MKRLLTVSLMALGIAAAYASQASNFRERASAHTVASMETIVDDINAEVSFGKDVAARILGRYALWNNQEVVRYVNLVGHAVALHASRPEVSFHFAVLDTDSINAYAAPGGYVFITRGALQNMQDESELAAVLAHEIAHVTQKHIVNELKIRGTEKTPEAGFARLIGASGDPTRVAFVQAIDKAVVMLFDSGLKREDELEADRVGTLILANTGYDATALSRYLERLQRLKGAHMNMLHATHPPFEQRLAQLSELITTEKLASAQAPRAKNRFDARIH